jgi:tetratricopeptide (TPR) repeat protein
LVNKEAFHKLLQDPAHITPDSLASLEELVRLFPFCSLAHTLIAKSHYDQATMLASQKVRKAAAYAVNRNKLKKIITGHWPEPPRVEIPPVFRPLGPEATPEALTLPPLPSLEVTAPELFAPELLVPEAAEPEATVPAVPPSPPGEVAAEPVAEALAAPEEPLLIEPPADLLFERLVGTLQPPPPVVYPSPEAEDEEEPEEPPLQLGHLNEDDQPIEEYSRRTKKYHQREIIESFIKSEPRISSLNNALKESYTPRDLSEKSTRPLEVVSENMANIYIRQRKYDKAIQMFNKLILKYPEKKENFVRRIEELKQL